VRTRLDHRSPIRHNPKERQTTMKWLTRERIRMDRVASAWLIKRFIDADAVFLFASHEDAMPRAQREEAVPFVVPGAELARHGDQITMDILIAKYSITDPAVLKLADILRAADIPKLRGTVAESEGVRAVVHGFFLLNVPDGEALALQLPVFDALYRYCQDVASRT
jgi:hypothetical protein